MSIRASLLTAFIRVGFVALAFVCSAANADKRVALVLGNSDYRSAPSLKNPSNDAEDVAAALTRIGFDVVHGVNLDYALMREQVRIFAEKLVGVKKGDETRFELDFPTDHYQKHLAGAPATFQVKVNEVYELAKPELNDEFAKGVGVESVEKLRELIRTNLQEEEDRRASEAAEIELLQTLTKESTFSEIPDLLVSEEVRRMIRELQSTLEERGGNMEDYLSSLKRSKDDLALDFIPQAMDRIKTAVLIKAIAKLENIAASDADIDAEQDRLLAGVKADDKNTREIIISPEYRDYIASQMRNRQVIELLKQKGIK